VSYKKLVLETIKDCIGLRARDVKLGHGSFLTMGFGNDIEYSMTIRGKSEIIIRPEWYLWIQSDNWEIHLSETGVDVLCSSRDKRTEISEKISWLEGKTLQKVSLPPSISDTKFIFGNFESLMVYSPEWYQETDSPDWILFTPQKKVLCVQNGLSWIEDE